MLQYKQGRPPPPLFGHWLCGATFRGQTAWLCHCPSLPSIYQAEAMHICRNLQPFFEGKPMFELRVMGPLGAVLQERTHWIPTLSHCSRQLYQRLCHRSVCNSLPRDTARPCPCHFLRQGQGHQFRIRDSVQWYAWPLGAQRMQGSPEFWPGD